MDVSLQSTLNLPVSSYRACFTITESHLLPDYAGSAVRGAFGHALKKSVCVTRQTDCKKCTLYRSCAYPYIFETPPALDAKKMRLYTAAPHPFVFELPLSAHKTHAKNTLDIGFSLFGRGNQFLPYVLHALEKAGKEGIGGRHQQRSQLALDKLQ
ncbi:MAG: hypothetical protein RQ982_01045, partial [Gammaproteobacteria bacterium]|nr:hypothetical protein [Gammaproteobacteria bacterium]